ncbi:unnamed protein product [Clonostachys byssicola]|uniref:Uncharacterized protein n=1 Tax=Clonostachys byssicola TaxID=160290 RepID=A0A9N9UTL4_9HYPO|nr:unnamed protein product [Clonostachys byssicola]
MAATISISVYDVARASTPPSNNPKLDILPPEVRLLIYEFTLVEIPRWDKKHKLECKYRPGSTQGFEPPPFVQSKITVSEHPWTVKTETPCSCAKRQGLSLLRVSKKHYEICSHIFLSKNTFCFLDAVEFLAIVGHSLHPELRDQVQDVSIMNPDHTGNAEHIRAPRARFRYGNHFWETLLKCRGLEKLEIPAAYIESTGELEVADYLNLLNERVPNLSRLHLNFLLARSSNLYSNSYPSPWMDPLAPQVIYARFSGQIRLSNQENGLWLSDGVDDLWRNLSNFGMQVDKAIKLKYFGLTTRTLPQYWLNFKLAEGLNTTHDTRRITLPSGRRVMVKFYGVPYSSRASRASARYKLSQEQKMREELAGASQKDLKKQFKEARRSSRESEMVAETRIRHEAQLDREMRRLALETEEKPTKESLKERQKKQRLAKTTRDIRAWGRKRVPNASSGY